MEFPPDWDVSPMEDFETHLPCIQSSSTDFAMELLAQLRPSGRILDHFQVALDGTTAISQELDLGQLIPSSTFKGYKLAFQYWPRDIRIRRNMLTSAWMDIPALVCANEAQVLDSLGAGVSAGSFMRMLDDLPEDGPESGSLRWAVIVGEDGGMRLQLQSLPCDAVSLSGKPATKG
jgi:hypothetical protein